MIRKFLIACVIPAFVSAALAQQKDLPPELAALPDEIKSVKWQSIDMATVQPVEHCRALLLMNHMLDELSANATSEADLMSAYLEKQNLGAQFASTPPPPEPHRMSYADAEKVAVAMLRGPMSTSYYATELGDLGPGALKSYAEMYERTCQRRWSEFDESRHLVRCMSSFLGNGGKLQDYDAWATAESARREQEHQAQVAAASAAKKASHNASDQQKMEAQLRQQQMELSQMQGALAAAHAQQQQQQQQQQQPPGPGNQTVTPAGQPAEAVGGGYVVDGSPYVYGGYGAYGGYAGYGYYGARPAGAAAAGAYAGAKAANNAGNYHAANASWNRDAAYHSTARAQTEARMSSFHGAGAGRR